MKKYIITSQIVISFLALVTSRIMEEIMGNNFIAAINMGILVFGGFCTIFLSIKYKVRESDDNVVIAILSPVALCSLLTLIITLSILLF